MTTNILLTGCTGFLGRNFIENTCLRRLNTRIVCISRRLPYCKRRSPDIVYLLIPQPANMPVEGYRKLIEEKQIEAIVHTAALVGEGKGSWRDYLDINVKWTLNLARAFTEANVNHRIFIHVSTVGVHGTIPRQLPANEVTPYMPDGYYHMSKTLAEKELIKMTTRTELPLLILRPTIMYGKYDQGFLWKILKISRKFLLPLPDNLRIHLLDVKTMVRVIDTCLLRPPKSNVFIVADRKPVKLRNLLLILRNQIPDIKFIEVPSKLVQIIERLVAPLRKYANITLLCKSWYYDISKLKSVLNVGLSDTVNRIGNYIWWYAKTH